jgi:hypothetical protein
MDDSGGHFDAACFSEDSLIAPANSKDGPRIRGNVRGMDRFGIKTARKTNGVMSQWNERRFRRLSAMEIQRWAW